MGDSLVPWWVTQGGSLNTPIKYGSNKWHNDYRAFGKSLQATVIYNLYVNPLKLFLNDRVILTGNSICPPKLKEQSITFEIIGR